MNIGLFQLENLMSAQVRFRLLDLREDPKSLPAPLEAIISRAEKVSAEGVSSHLEKTLPDRTSPVILLSEDGIQAQSLRSKLESAGYSNIYVVEGGVAGLLLEL